MNKDKLVLIIDIIIKDFSEILNKSNNITQDLIDMDAIVMISTATHAAVLGYYFLSKNLDKADSLKLWGHTYDLIATDIACFMNK